MQVVILTIVIVFLTISTRMADADDRSPFNRPGLDNFLRESFRWTTGRPVLRAAPSDGEEWISVKDPSLVRYKGQWHLFCTVRGRKRSHAIIYLSFPEWSQAEKAMRHVLHFHEGYFSTPQVFYFSPHRKWYLICQASHDSWEPQYQPAYSTSANIADPNSWTPLTPLFGKKPNNIKAWLDFWVICDEEKAYLFFTSLDGKMWRAQTSLSDFPLQWSEPIVALHGDVFEASHTYRLKGLGTYLTVIEAQRGYSLYGRMLRKALSLIDMKHDHGWRYYKAYVADSLEGSWKPLADGKGKVFASIKNVRQKEEHWTDSISHGELIRAGYDETLEVDPADLKFLFQGVTDGERKGEIYGEIPWRLGILTPEN